jgi:hypothetical protein
VGRGHATFYQKSATGTCLLLAWVFRPNLFGEESGGGVSVFQGQLQRGSSPPERASIQFDDGRCRVWNERRRIGSWELSEVQTERTGVAKFHLTIGDLDFFFSPDDPPGFSDEAGAVVDLRAKTGRFGLAERIRQVTGG